MFISKDIRTGNGGNTGKLQAVRLAKDMAVKLNIGRQYIVPLVLEVLCFSPRTCCWNMERFQVRLILNEI